VLAFDEAPLYARLLGALPPATNNSAAGLDRRASMTVKAGGGNGIGGAAAAAIPADVNEEVDSTSSVQPLPLPTPFHLLLKVHLSDGSAGQCGVCLPRSSFEAGATLEFLEPLSRDGVALMHPQSKLPVRVHFLVELTSALASQAQQQQVRPKLLPAGGSARKL
jgi:hypothetical protein